MVDSGASTTSFPLALLGALGIDRADLAQADDGQGVGSSFNVWSWPGQLTRQVVAYAQQPDGTVDVQRDASRQIPACAQRRVGVGCYVGAKPLAVLDPRRGTASEAGRPKARRRGLERSRRRAPGAPDAGLKPPLVRQASPSATVERRLDLQRVSPVRAVLDLDPAAAAGEVVTAAFLGDDALEAEIDDALPERIAVRIGRRRCNHAPREGAIAGRG